MHSPMPQVTSRQPHLPVSSGFVWSQDRGMARAKARALNRGIGACRTLELTPGVAQDKAPRSQVDAWLRDLTARERSLPWAHLHFSIGAPPGQGPGPPGAPVVACSKAVNNASCRRIPRPVTVAPPVGRQRSVGGDGKPVNAIGPATTASNGDASSNAAIAAAVANDWPRAGAVRRRTRPGRARASAQWPPTRILRPGPARDRVVTTCWSCGRSRPRNVFARPCAAWRYVACWIARRATGSAAGAGDGNAGSRVRLGRTPREACL